MHNHFPETLNDFNVDYKINRFISSITYSVLKLSFSFVKWLRFYTGLIGKCIVLLLLSPFIIIFFQLAVFIHKRFALKIRNSKQRIKESYLKMDFAAIKEEETLLNKMIASLMPLYDLRKKSTSGKFLKRLYKYTEMMMEDVKELKEFAVSQHSYNAEEFSAEQIKVAQDYWDNFKKKSPKAYKEIEQDNSSEESIFNLKRGNKTKYA